MAGLEAFPISMLKEMFTYDPISGVLYWNKRSETTLPNFTGRAAWNTKFAGKPAGRSHYKTGHLQVTLMGKIYSVHRICFAIFHNRYPVGCIDHIDHDPENNSIQNLRDVSLAENSRNIRIPARNTSGAMGVVKVKRSGKWQAQIGFNRAAIYLGIFNTFEEAIDCRRAAEERLGFHKNHGAI